VFDSSSSEQVRGCSCRRIRTSSLLLILARRSKTRTVSGSGSIGYSHYGEGFRLSLAVLLPSVCYSIKEGLRTKTRLIRVSGGLRSSSSQMIGFD
jgi:hypothetical protein